MPLPRTPQPRIQIQAVEPLVDCGRYAIKRTVGDTVDVYATVFKDGHDTLAGTVRVKAPGERGWREEPLRLAQACPMTRTNTCGAYLTTRTWPTT